MINLEKVTKLPWRVDADGHIEGGERPGWLIHSAIDDVGISRADAEYIVLCCNHFPEVLEALEHMVREFGQFGSKLQVKKDFHKILSLENARRTIAKIPKE